MPGGEFSIVLLEPTPSMCLHLIDGERGQIDFDLVHYLRSDLWMLLIEMSADRFRSVSAGVTLRGQPELTPFHTTKNDSTS